MGILLQVSQFYSLDLFNALFKKSDHNSFRMKIWDLGKFGLWDLGKLQNVSVKQEL